MTILTEPAPATDTPWAAETLWREFGVEAALAPLVSERDRNFMARCADGRAFVVKVSNSAEDVAVVAMENAAMLHVEQVAPALPVPRLLRSLRGGEVAVRVAAPDGRRHLVRVVTTLPGAPVDGAAPERFAGELGGACAALATSLRGFFHAAAGRTIEWDPRRVGALRPHVDLLHPDRQALITGFLDRFDALGERVAPLPAWPLHADVTLSNVLAAPDGAITGLIDFGDMHHTARVCDLAISLASLLRVADDPWAASAQFLDGYQRQAILEPAEVELVGELVLARLVATVLISAWRQPAHADNLDYITSLDAGSWRVLDDLAELDPIEISQRFQRICGTSRVASAQRPDGSLLARRRKLLGGQLSPLFYRDPLQIVRGEGAWLIDAAGRRYLDAYNNVPVVGHAHPAVGQAIARQLATVNVSSRYLHHNIVELAERITSTMPAELDTCVFVNSGSEANDLAWRMAVEYTGHSGAVVTDWAYHGVSQATAAMSSNTWGAGYRPDHVTVFEPPYGGSGGDGPDGEVATRRVRAAVEDLGHRGLALLAVDPMFTSPGVLEPADEFMAGLVDQSHAAGGLFLADEVQAGYGRGGGHLWRFRDFGVVPDFVTLGKPMGNGHPIAALVTRRDIAERFAAVDEYFSTFGGNPVSCAAGLAVLDVVEQERLTERAGVTGIYLRDGIARLAGRFPRQLGAVRGRGLIAGVDVHGEDASWLAEALRDKGVLVSTTGRGAHVLKVRPPLVWRPRHADVFLAALESVLTEAAPR